MTGGLAVLALALGGGPAAAAPPPAFRITVRADGVERRRVPVTCRLAAGADLDAAVLAALPARPGVRLDPPRPCQAEVERGPDGTPAALRVSWVEPFLPADGAVERELAWSDPPAGEGGFRARAGIGERDLLYGDRVLATYVGGYDPARHAGSSKPFHHVMAFDRGVPITKGPGGTYPHHRGLFLGWNRVGTGDGKRYDFWHCPDVAQRHRADVPERESFGPVAGRTSEDVEWTAPGGEPLVRERRELAAWWVGEDERLFDVTSTLEAVAGPVGLEGDPHHAGFHVRAVEGEGDPRRYAAFLRAPGARAAGDDVWEECAWAAMSFPFGERTYTVLHLDHPANPRPMRYSTRPYGRLGSYFPAMLHPGRPVVLRFRVWVSADAPVAALCAARHEDFVRPVRAEARATSALTGSTTCW